NDELGALKEVLEALPNITHENARVVFLTFHSLEDKLVKETFRVWAKEGRGEVVTKKPVTPSKTEVGQNPRSRSAKLRTFKFTHFHEAENI
ncbi:MAG: 16S rRNA (cytosine(1402)-N(4))-methyltransferase, partial [Candidatus Pacebacteria bacterium]|nr:16S rRNA (cytosine(1402)-N(4))-methyltransferase [Candidatus Paceibacterota bacterium]